MNYQHTPVLLKEFLQYLNIQKNHNYIDCTLGLGGYAKEILEAIKPNGKLLAIEQDPQGLSEAKIKLEKYKDRIVFHQGNFKDIKKIAEELNFIGISGVVMDLGLASWQIEDVSRGISFSKLAPLDMRLDPNADITAKYIVNKYPEKQLANLFFQLGDVRKSRLIAKKIVDYRTRNTIETTEDLVNIIGLKNPKILAPIFQALRIEVNSELENLSKVLPQCMEILESGGRLVVISYHSGEDRIVKNFLRSNKGEIKILTKKPIISQTEEILINSRARSAKLRAGEKI